MARLLPLGPVLLALLVAPGSARAAGPVVVVPLEGSVQPGAVRYLERALREADRRGAAVTVLELDTPGGLLTSLRRMTAAITRARRPVVIYVTPAGARAASAGFFLLLAGDLAAMAPGTNTGAAHPVGLGRSDRAADRAALDKATQDAAALARALAAARGRPVDQAELAVRKSRAFSDGEALALGLIDLVVPTRAALLGALEGRRVRRSDGRLETLHLGAPPLVVALGPSRSERALMLLAQPDLAYLLLLAGLLGLLIELLHPGALLPGIVGGLCLLLALFGLSVLPVRLVGALLLALGLGLFVAEALVVSHGLLGLGGLAAFLAGSLMLVEAPLRVDLRTALPATLALAAALLLLASRAVAARAARPLSGLEALVGQEGEVAVALEPTGKVFVHGEYWDAVAPGRVARGARVRVVEVVGSRLRVEAAGPPPAPA